MRTYTNPKNGEVITTELDTFKAREIIKEKAPASDSFAHDLAGKMSLSASQIFWLIKKAMQYSTENNSQAVTSAQTSVQTGAGFTRLQEMFTHAKAEIKRPKITLKNNNNKIVISLAPDTGKNVGHLYIKVNDNYMGKVSPEGKFYPVFSCDKETQDYLKEFSENPEIVAAKYGHETGNCCFCARLLTDQRSVKVGYGPICAQRFNLAHEANE